MPFISDMNITSKPCYQLISIKWQRLPKVNEMANNEFQLQRKAIDKSLKKCLTVKCPFSSSSNISWKEISVWRLTSALKAPLKANPIHSDVLVHFRSSSTTSSSNPILRRGCSAPTSSSSSPSENHQDRHHPIHSDVLVEWKSTNRRETFNPGGFFPF